MKFLKNLFIIYIICLILFTNNFFVKSDNKLGTVYGRINLLPREHNRYSSISISLEGADRTTFLNDDGIFVFYNIPEGVYMVNVNDPIYEYEQVFLEVTSKDTKAFSFNPRFGKKGNRLVEYPFEVNTIAKIKYEEDSPNVILGILKSPYGIIISISLVMYLCMQMIPQDQLKEMEQINKQMGGGIQNMFKNK